MTGLEVILTAVAGFIGNIIGKKTERKKARAELDGLELDNVGKAVKIWKELSEVLQAKVDELIEEIHELRREIEVLRKENANLKKTLENNTKSNNT